MKVIKRKGTQETIKAEFKANIINHNGNLTFKEARTNSDGRNCIYYIQPTDEEKEELIEFLNKNKQNHDFIKEFKTRCKSRNKFFVNCLAWALNKVI